MKKIMRFLGIASLMTCVATGASAQAKAEEKDSTKQGFFKQAFNDMKESAKRQSEIDKANLKAHKMESRAFYEEQKAKSKRNVRKEAEEKKYRRQMEDAKARQEAAAKRIEDTKD